jgi:hypothetical protein
MIGKIILIISIAASAYGVASCTISKYEKDRIAEEKKEIRAANDIDLLNKINDMRVLYKADISWIEKIGLIGNEKKRFKNLYTSEIQSAFLINKPILIFGDIEDIESYNPESYLLTLSLSSFKLEMKAFFQPNIKIKIQCTKNLIDRVIQDHSNSYRKTPGFNINVALITSITDIKGYTYPDSENLTKEGKILLGDCKEFLLAPQGRGVLSKNLPQWN